MPLHLFIVNGLDTVFCLSGLRVFWAFEHTEVALSYYSSRACYSVPKQVTIKTDCIKVYTWLEQFDSYGCPVTPLTPFKADRYL